MNNFEKLKQEILKLSSSNNWASAKKEWVPIGMEEVDDPEECLCGHFPITEVLILRNKATSKVVRVGNVCVNKFIQKNKNFDSYRRITKNLSKSMSEELLEFAYNHKWIALNEYSFYNDISRKRKLTEKQLNWKQSINKKVVSSIRRQQR